MPSNPYYPWFASDFWTDTAHLKFEERAFYRDFLDRCWINKGKISKEKFRDILNFPKKKFEKYWEKIQNFLVYFQETDEYSQKKLLEIFQNVSDISTKNSENAKNRWKKEKTRNATAYANNEQSTLFADAIQNQSKTQNQNHKKDPGKPRKKNPIWDIICILYELKPVTKTELSRIGKISRDLKLKETDPEEIQKQYNKYNDQYSIKMNTPEALLKHWDQLKAIKKPLTLMQKAEAKFGKN